MNEEIPMITEEECMFTATETDRLHYNAFLFYTATYKVYYI